MFFALCYGFTHLVLIQLNVTFNTMHIKNPLLVIVHGFNYRWHSLELIIPTIELNVIDLTISITRIHVKVGSAV